MTRRQRTRAALVAAAVTLSAPAWAQPDGREAGDAPARMVLLAPECLAAVVDTAAFVDLLRVELRDQGVRSLELEQPAGSTRGSVADESVVLALRCGSSGDVIEIDYGTSQFRMPLADVAGDARPRVLALALAENLRPIWLARTTAPDPTPGPAAGAAGPATSPDAAVAEQAPLDTAGSTWNFTVHGAVLFTADPAINAGVWLSGYRGWRWGGLILQVGTSLFLGENPNGDLNLATAELRLRYDLFSLWRVKVAADLGSDIAIVWGQGGDDGKVEAGILASGGLVPRLPLSRNLRADWELVVGQFYPGSSTAVVTALGITWAW